MLPELNPERALIFRVTHRDNLEWVCRNGLHCRRSVTQDPAFVPIGLTELIDKRHEQVVAHPMGGRLSDYIPFYFTPLSMMAFNIRTGRGVRQRANSEIVILVSSLQRLVAANIPFLFTDRHASVVGARFSSSLAELDRIDWSILQHRDFSRDNDDIEKTSRYQAEALVHRHAPVDALLGIACYDAGMRAWAQTVADRAGSNLKIVARPSWYFQ